MRRIFNYFLDISLYLGTKQMNGFLQFDLQQILQIVSISPTLPTKVLKRGMNRHCQTKTHHFSSNYTTSEVRNFQNCYRVSNQFCRTKKPTTLPSHVWNKSKMGTAIILKIDAADHGTFKMCSNLAQRCKTSKLVPVANYRPT